MKIRVGLDVSPLEQTRAGTARYLDGLVRGLALRDDVELRQFRFRGRGRVAAVARDAAWYVAGLPLAARRARVDVLHCPTYRAPLRPPMPMVVTVHDVAVLRHPELFNHWNRMYSRLTVGRVIAAARRVIAVSQFSKQELVEVVGAAEDKIDVVPPPADTSFAPQGRAADGDYVLAVGTLEPRKNLPRLADAAARAGVELRVVGPRGWGGVEVARDGVHWLGDVTDEELGALYRGALCLAYPSLYEGFGIPILEAFASGTPVVTSAGGSTEEVAGGAAVLVDPRDPGSIASGIEEAVRRREELRRLGLARAAEFSWADTVDRIVAVYRRALE